MGRVPMIQFRYGIREAVSNAVHAAATAAGAEVGSRYLRPSELPPRMQRPKISQQEQMYIMLGGCEDYELKKKRRK